MPSKKVVSHSVITKSWYFSSSEEAHTQDDIKIIHKTLTPSPPVHPTILLSKIDLTTTSAPWNPKKVMRENADEICLIILY